MNNRSGTGSSLILVALGIAACQPAKEQNRIVGQLESDRIELAPEFAEPIVERRVLEGQRVQRGELVIQQDTSRARMRLREAQATLAQQQARLDELIRGPRREQIEAAQANVVGSERNVEFREAQLIRAQTLLDQELASPDVRDQAKAALDAAEAGLEVSLARLEELLTGTTIEELNQARASVEGAAARADQLALDLQRLSTRAPVDGTVDSLLLEPGERPRPGMPMAVMLSGQQPYARIYVPEAARVAVSPGTPATVYIDGIDQPVQGHVRWVASEAAFTPYFALTEHDRGRLTYMAKVDLDYGGDRLPDGVPLEVELHRDAR